MMAEPAPFLVGPAESRAMPWRVITDSDMASGMAVGDARLPPRTAGPNRHVHTREDEGVYVITGVLTAEVGDQRYEVGPESFLWMPRGLPHTFANLGDEEVWTVGVINPGGFEHFFAEIAEYVGSLHGPPDQEVILAINERYGVYPVEGPPLVHAPPHGQNP
jgi:mannose-6-phosphate isomerase-like protein (cupin superfamily)